MKLRVRLQRLEKIRIDVGCPACHDRRGRIMLQTAKRLLDGTVVPVENEPQPCLRCGGIPEQIIEVVEPIVGKRTDTPEREVLT